MPIHRSRTRPQSPSPPSTNPQQYKSVTVTLPFTTHDFNRISKAADAMNMRVIDFIRGAATGLATKVNRAHSAAGKIARPDTYSHAKRSGA